MNGPVSVNLKWRIVSALFFGFIFFLMGFGGFLLERRNLLSDTVRYLKKAGSYTALKERIKGLNTKEAVPVWKRRSEIELIFYYPVSQSGAIKRLKTFWPRDYKNFSKILFYSISDRQSWGDQLNRFINENEAPHSIILGYYPVIRQANGADTIKYLLYLWMPAPFMNSFLEELTHTSLWDKRFDMRWEPTAGGTVFELTWKETQNSTQINSVMDLPQLVTEVLTLIHLVIGNNVSLY
ncbi:MAG: hypothetical protein K6U80_14680 [Firmicutes bacterium]|nr:hypothetical protein [Bacillota bacterium]